VAEGQLLHGQLRRIPRNMDMARIFIMSAVDMSF
jgi:hypothetical protein